MFIFMLLIDYSNDPLCDIYPLFTLPICNHYNHFISILMLDYSDTLMFKYS